MSTASIALTQPQALSGPVGAFKKPEASAPAASSTVPEAPSSPDRAEITGKASTAPIGISKPQDLSEFYKTERAKIEYTYNTNLIKGVGIAAVAATAAALVIAPINAFAGMMVGAFGCGYGAGRIYKAQKLYAEQLRNLDQQCGTKTRSIW